jgi:hypothetical protein
MPVSVSGCATTHLGTPTMLSTRPVSLDGLDLDALAHKRGVVRTDKRNIQLGIPLGMPQVSRAVEDALRKGNGDLLLDPVIKLHVFSLFIFGHQAVSVEGNVVNSKEKGCDKERSI